MRQFTQVALLVMAALLANLQTRACGSYADFDEAQYRAHLASDLTAGDDATREAAARGLRDLGPIGLKAAFSVHAEAIDHARREPSWNPPEWQQLSAALDTVAGQRDVFASGLYWYDDLAQAQAAATASGKPILSLRLLGQLDEALTCANSRFFRTVLYSDPEMADYLRSTYVLHWQSVRDVPIITIDMRNGRQIKQTITGNSLHWVLAADGTILDALPGVYTTAAFRSRLEAGASTAATWQQTEADDRSAFLDRHYGAEIVSLQKAWGNGLQAAGVELGDGASAQLASLDPKRPPTARDSSARTMSKAFVERPMFRALGLDTRMLDAATSEQLWLTLAASRGEFTLSENSQNLIRRQFNGTPDAAEAFGEEQIRTLQINVAVESQKNEYRLRHEILQGIVRQRYEGERGFLVIDTTPGAAEQGQQDPVVSTTNWVYANVFRTPLDDPWLGLSEPSIYTGLAHSGRIVD